MSDQEAGNEPGNERTFSQADVNRIVSKELKKFADYDDLKTKVGELDTLRAEIEKLREEKELEGKSAADRAKAEADRELRTLKTRLDDLAKTVAEREAEATSARTQLRRERIDRTLQSAFNAAKAYGPALDDAITSFVRLAGEEGIEVGDDGNIAAVTINGKTFDSVKTAVEAFLGEKPHFRSAAPVGAGTPRPNAGPANHMGSLDDMSPDQLIAIGVAQELGARK